MQQQLYEKLKNIMQNKNVICWNILFLKKERKNDANFS